MFNLEDVTLIYDGSTGNVIFIAPHPLIFNGRKEFTSFMDYMKTQVQDSVSESSINSDYASEVIEEWTQQINQYQETEN